jgi:hypothetical protein
MFWWMLICFNNVIKILIEYIYQKHEDKYRTAKAY